MQGPLIDGDIFFLKKQNMHSCEILKRRDPGTHNSLNDRGVPSASNSCQLEIPIGEIKNKEKL